MEKTFTCYSCGVMVTEHPIVSKIDSEMNICSKCGMLEDRQAVLMHSFNRDIEDTIHFEGKIYKGEEIKEFYKHFKMSKKQIKDFAIAIYDQLIIDIQAMEKDGGDSRN